MGVQGTGHKHGGIIAEGDQRVLGLAGLTVTRRDGKSAATVKLEILIQPALGQVIVSRHHQPVAGDVGIIAERYAGVGTACGAGDRTRHTTQGHRAGIHGGVIRVIVDGRHRQAARGGNADAVARRAAVGDTDQDIRAVGNN